MGEIKTLPQVSSRFQRSARDASQPPSPRMVSHSEPITPSGLLESTRDTQVSEPREQEKPRPARSELDEGRSPSARPYLQLIQFGSLKSTKLYYAYILYWDDARKLMQLHAIFICNLLFDTRQIS